MIDFISKVKSVKISWVKRAIVSPNKPWVKILTALMGEIPFSYILKSSSDCNPYIQNLPLFYKNIYNVWKQFKMSDPITYMEIKSQNLWLNNHITVQNKPILWKSWLKRNIKIIGDLLDNEGNFLSLDDLNMKYQVNCNFIQHMRIRQAIPHSWRLLISARKTTTNKTKLNIYINKADRTIDFLNSKTKDIYWLLVDGTTKLTTLNCVKRWHEIYNIDSDIWNNMFKIPFKACRETHLQSFQYRITQRILPCNTWLFKLKVSDTENCTYSLCHSDEKDTIQHFLVNCEPVQIFWKNFISWWNKLNISKLQPPMEENIVLGFPIINDEDIVLNFCLILAKYFIYICKRNQTSLSFISYLRKLKNKVLIEENIHKSHGTFSKFCVTWGLIGDYL